MTPEGVDLAIRTIIGEAARQPFAGQQAVANVILNRLHGGQYGTTLQGVVLAPSQFEPWSTRRGELMAVDPASPEYQTAAKAWQAALQRDVTGGATYFLNPDIVRQRTGGTLPRWAQGPGMRIGGHVFYGGASGGQPAVAGYTAPNPPDMAKPATDVAQVFTNFASGPPPRLTSQYNSPQVPPASGTESAVDDPAFEPRALQLRQQATLRARQRERMSGLSVA